MYLTVEAGDAALQDDFRRPTIPSQLVSAVLARIVFLLVAEGAPQIRRYLASSWWAWPLQLAAVLFAAATLRSVWRRRFRIARLCAAGQVSLILWGWALGGLLLFPSLRYLFRVFKGKTAAHAEHEPHA